MFELPADASEPEFTALLEYWRRKAPSGCLPGRQHIDPIELPPTILPHLLLLDVERPGGLYRFRFRVAGTAFAALIGRDPTGLFYDEVGTAEQVRPVSEALTAVVETRSPVYLACPLTLPRKEYTLAKRLGLPLARDGRTVDMILASWLPVKAAPGVPDEAGGSPGQGSRVIPSSRL